MKHSTIAALLVCSAALGTFGCSGVDGGDDPATAEPSTGVLVERQLLAQLTVGPIEVNFLRTVDPDGTVRVSLQETAPNHVSASPMRQLAIEQGLTALETFLALAPEGQAVPAALTAEHSAQARSLGRADVTAVRQAKFDPSEPVEKSTASCDNWVLNTQSTSLQAVNVDKLDWVTGVRAASTGWTNRNVTVGACNESTASMVAARFWHIFDPRPEGVLFFEEIDNTWSTDGPWFLAGRTSVRWYNWALFPPETCNGFICTSDPMAYRVRGISANQYHLRAGEVIRKVN